MMWLMFTGYTGLVERMIYAMRGGWKTGMDRPACNAGSARGGKEVMKVCG